MSEPESNAASPKLRGDWSVPWESAAAPPITFGQYTFAGLREKDLEQIRIFRNRQMSVLRQTEPLSRDDQVRWYRGEVLPTFSQARPGQLLVSILSGGGLAGYGGLTNISWPNLRGELSFLVDPERAAQADVYREDFEAFLGFLTRWALTAWA